MGEIFETPFFGGLREGVEKLGGLFNAHLHIDRAETFDATLEMLGGNISSTASSISLSKKHTLIPMLHNSACYEPDLLEARVQSCIDRMAKLGTTRAHSVVDVTNDRVGLSALERLLSISQKSRGYIDFRVGAYSPLGFRDDEPGRWSLLKEAAKSADFLGSLPERDDQRDYPDHIGFKESCRRIIDLSAQTGKAVHIHVDQKNHDQESGSECVVRLVREMGIELDRQSPPLIWLIHVISPSTYDVERFSTLASDLAELNIGIICCPSAALSMRQLRPVFSPTYNSIARVLEFLCAGVSVRLGSDNVCDITSPAGTLDLMHEIFVLAHALRYFDIGVLSKLGAGLDLTQSERDRVKVHLQEDRQEVESALASYHESESARGLY